MNVLIITRKVDKRNEKVNDQYKSPTSTKSKSKTNGSGYKGRYPKDYQVQDGTPGKTAKTSASPKKPDYSQGYKNLRQKRRDIDDN